MRCWILAIGVVEADRSVKESDNFVLNEADRIVKESAMARLNDEDKACVETWRSTVSPHGLQEVMQPSLTCENSWGWSRIDRIYTSLHTADIANSAIQGYVLPYPRHMSDHHPVAFSIKARHKQTQYSSIPTWTIKHPRFQKETQKEFEYLCKEHVISQGSEPTAWTKINLLKQAGRNASSFIKEKCQQEIAATTVHKLATTLAFMRAIREGDMQYAGRCQNRYPKLRSVKLDEGASASGEFLNIKEHAVELMQIDIKEKTEELKACEATSSRYALDSKRKSIQTRMSQMIPGKSLDIAAVMDERANIATGAEEIATALNKHWGQVFAQQESDNILRQRWLEKIRNRFKATKEQLRPTMEDAQSVIDQMTPSSCGPDDIPFEFFKEMKEMAAQLLLAAANALLDGAELPDDDFNFAFMIYIPKAQDGELEDGTKVYTPGSTRPISIVDACNRLLACIFKTTLETGDWTAYLPNAERLSRG